jgi:hypothetical protein
MAILSSMISRFVESPHSVPLGLQTQSPSLHRPIQAVRPLCRSNYSMTHRRADFALPSSSTGA